MIIALLLFSAAGLSAKVTLPPVLGDNMVLQQKTRVALWGQATGKKLSITTSWSKEKTVVTPDADGKWFVRIPTPSAGGPYTISFNDGEKLTLENVLVGEVWYCGGQSNMEMPVRGFEGQPVEHGTDFIAAANPRVPIRICKVENVKSCVPMQNSKVSWVENRPEEVAFVSAAAYFFACKLYEVLNVPIGIMSVDWGGSAIEAWLPRELLEKEFPGEFNTAILDTTEDAYSLKNDGNPCILWNGMVSSLVPFTFKGMLWYQGETNRGRPEQYTRLQVAYVKMMRERFQNPDAPFYFVQIAPYPYGQYGRLFTSGYFYEAQQKTLSLIPNSAMVTTTDIGSFYTIHPPKKLEVGKRLAYLALVKEYGIKGFNPIGPSYESVRFEGDKALVSFTTDKLGLSPRKTPLGGFELAGEDRVFHPASAEAEKNVVTVSCEEVPHPVAVRYCFRNWAEGSLFNVYGIPAAPFRTDDWDDLRE